ncbi:MAG: hypothetical protein IT384_06570 [Deltaproteobacteria bacterium]|nr:hypothetical protein [Deltaproteobacteria bacterium]
MKSRISLPSPVRRTFGTKDYEVLREIEAAAQSRPRNKPPLTPKEERDVLELVAGLEGSRVSKRGLWAVEKTVLSLLAACRSTPGARTAPLIQALEKLNATQPYSPLPELKELVRKAQGADRLSPPLTKKQIDEFRTLVAWLDVEDARGMEEALHQFTLLKNLYGHAWPKTKLEAVERSLLERLEAERAGRASMQATKIGDELRMASAFGREPVGVPPEPSTSAPRSGAHFETSGVVERSGVRPGITVTPNGTRIHEL